MKLGWFGILTLMAGQAQAAEGLPAGLVSIGDQTRHVLVVDKSKHVLRLYGFQDGHPKMLSEFPSDSGRVDGEKMKANDFKTPTGIYFLQKRLHAPEIPFSLYGSLAFTTDYPNVFDKRDDKSGSGIWLHAVPDSVALTRGSRGCVVVRNDAIKELDSSIDLRKTPLVIFDHVDEVDVAGYDQEHAKFLGYFEQWRKAWESEDIEAYMKFYDETFKNNQMNYEQWYAHKKKLRGLYSSIKVKLSEPLIVRNRNQVVIRTFQEYESNQHKDYGLKTIHARWSPENGFKIIREDWEPRPAPAMTLQQAGTAATQEESLLTTPRAANPRVDPANPTSANERLPGSTEPN